MNHRAGFFFLSFFLAVVLLSGCSKAPDQKKGTASEQRVTAPVRGPGDAPYKIEQFSDFYCPYCKEQARVFKKVMAAYPGKIQMSFRHFPLAGDAEEGSFPVHAASVCAAEQNKFWEFHDFIFSADNHPIVDQVAEATGLDRAKLDDCLKSGRGKSAVLADWADSQTRGISGAPTSFINGEKIVGVRPFDFFAEEFDPEFAAQKEAERKQQYDEMLKKIDFTETDRPWQGAENAPVTMVELSDFHCFFCQKLTPVLNELMAAYPGKIRRVWRHFPLPIHPSAPFAHLASECAHRQKKFWEFHDKVFADPSKAKTQEDFKRIAGELGLDLNLFDTCYEDQTTKKKIENDLLLGFSKKVGATPSLLINDELVVGVKPIEELKVIVERKLAEAESGEALQAEQGNVL